MTTTATDEVLAMVREALAAVLEKQASDFGPDTVLADVGTDSLVLVEVAEIVEERLVALTGVRVRIGDEDLDAFATVRDAVDYLSAQISTAPTR